MHYQIIAATGITKPELDVPFISLEELLQGGGEKFIDQLATGIDSPQTMAEESQQLTPELCERYLGDYFTFLNPKKLTGILWEYSEVIATHLDGVMTNAFRIDLIMHLAGALERTVIKDEISAPRNEDTDTTNQSKLSNHCGNWDYKTRIRRPFYFIGRIATRWWRKVY
ncbi:hypothetical protein WP50_24370 [Lactiplantibacillus plantarum]|nr:hypothetical protein WP50_24370 [Lactiplantibacillus plantarum]